MGTLALLTKDDKSPTLNLKGVINDECLEDRSYVVR